MEDDIMACWQIVNDIEFVGNAMLDKNLSADEIANMLIGLTTLYNMKFDKLFDTFEESLK